jgi:hypothetical protein
MMKLCTPPHDCLSSCQLLLNVFVVAGLKRLVYVALNDLYIWRLFQIKEKTFDIRPSHGTLSH